METNPPKLVETILGSLIPPACREEVLGDWHERYRSPGQYVWDGIRTLPFLIASQVRRSFSIELFLSQACALYIAFGGASLVGGPAYLYERLLSFAVVIGFVLFTLVLVEPYADPQGDSPSSVRIVTSALITAYIAQSVLGLTASELMFPMWLMLTGNVISIPLLMIVRRWYRQVHHSPTPVAATAAPSLEELRRRSEEEHRKAWHVNFAWVMAAYLVLFFSWPAAPITPRGSGLIFLLTVGVLIRLGRMKEGKVGRAYPLALASLSAGRNPYRIKLLGKRDGLQLWSGTNAPWNLGGPAIFLLLILAVPYIGLTLLWVFGRSLPEMINTPRWWLSLAAVLALSVSWMCVRKVNDRASRTIQREIDALDESERKH
jgi:hypothetical protein